jgi:DnaJ-class molecular chaperone
MSQVFDFVEVMPPPNYARPDEMPWHHDEEPWDILRIRWDAGPEEVDRAFKARAREVHPDRATDDIDRARREREMKKVSAAYEWMKQRAGRL